MNENPMNQGNMLDTNDSLEAVSVFRHWKNIFFGIVVLCLVLNQAAFWLINLGIVTPPAVTESTVAGTTNTPAGLATGTTPPPAVVAGPNTKAAEPAKANKGLLGGLFGFLDFDRVARAVELVNGVLLVTAALLAASIFFGLMVSLVGRLGGLNHISRAFVLALIAVALLIPWQTLNLSVLGVTWTPDELIHWLPVKGASLGNTIIFYLRFTGYWLAVMLLLFLSVARTSRWSKSILHRLEII